MRLQLAATEYGDLLRNEPSPIAPSTIAAKCLEALVEDFNYLRSNCSETLGLFLDYIT